MCARGDALIAESAPATGAVIALSRLAYRAVTRIANERAQQGRSISQLIPLGVVARQTRYLPPENHADMAQGDLSGEGF